jgi:hypothetical protein
MRLRENPMKKRHSMAIYGSAILAITLSSVVVFAQRSADKPVDPSTGLNAVQNHQNPDDRRPKPPTNLRVE